MEESGSDADAMDEKDSFDNESDPSAVNDGFAEMMTKILNQKVDHKIPVLAKRKTSLMKEHEATSQMKVERKQVRVERVLKRERFLVVPSPLNLDFERQLRKVATRGGQIVLL